MCHVVRHRVEHDARLDIFWLRDESLEDSANLPEPHVLAEEIADDLRAALEQIEDVLMDIQARGADVTLAEGRQALEDVARSRRRTRPE